MYIHACKLTLNKGAEQHEHVCMCACLGFLGTKFWKNILNFFQISLLGSSACSKNVKDAESFLHLYNVYSQIWLNCHMEDFHS
jgi:hypothetical protein